MMFNVVNDERAKWKIASKLESRSLLIAVNCLAGLAIFFFGKCTPIALTSDPIPTRFDNTNGPSRLRPGYDGWSE